MKNIFNTHNFFWGIGLILLVNMGVFFYVNTRPIHWLMDENPSYYFFWSADGIHKVTLHSGFNQSDLLKPLISRYNDGAFRLRQFSYFIEMISFKFWQFFEVGYFRNYTLIILHLVNVLLLGLLIYRLFKNSDMAWFAGLLMLNTGVSLTTLLFPCRLGKILVMTLFLGNFLLMVWSNIRLDKLGGLRLSVIFTVLLMSFLTDESFFFLFFIYLFYLYLYQGKEVFFSRRLWKYLGITCLGLVIFAAIAYAFSENAVCSIRSWQGDYLNKFLLYFRSPQTLWDFIRAFFYFFLRRNFGYWDLSLLGVFAFISFLFVLWMASKSRIALKEKYFCMGLIMMVVLKGFLMPHMRLHPFIMPQDAFFPTMLFFSYYYVYPDCLILILCLSVWLTGFVTNKKRLIVLLCGASVMSVSNMAHWKDNLSDTMAFHHLNLPVRVQVIEDVTIAREFIKIKRLRPVYLSFPSGDDKVVDGRLGDDKTWPIYPAYLLTMLLPSFEKQEAITSLENVCPQAIMGSGNELLKANFFLDVRRHSFYNLGVIKHEYGLKEFVPSVIKEKTPIPEMTVTVLKTCLIFFVKGQSDLILTMNDQKAYLKQVYGSSYQMFKIDMTKREGDYKIRAHLEIHPGHGNHEVYLVGPFLL
ncbi:MAG: hypothetical protein HQL13_00115 [Candidatus Omnitrophica bacterium]|nr:hypothetical protein [Candidatus Omnitrophota bacterium]